MMWRREWEYSQLVLLSAEDETVRAKDDTKPSSPSNGALPLKFVRGHVGAIGRGHIMFEGQPSDVFSAFEGEFEREREEVPVPKVRDLVCEEPGVLIERCLGGDGEAICMQESNVRQSKELRQGLQLDGILAHMKNAMAEGAQGTKCM